MSVVDWVNLICAIGSLTASILIGIWQIRQEKRMDKLELIQIEKENKRNQEIVEIEARRFLEKYNNIIGLLPLCAIAVAYNQNRPYSREMYSEFRFLSKDIRLKIFEHCGWVMCDINTDSFFEDCLTVTVKSFGV